MVCIYFRLLLIVILGVVFFRTQPLLQIEDDAESDALCNKRNRRHSYINSIIINTNVATVTVPCMRIYSPTGQVQPVMYVAFGLNQLSRVLSY